jgi:hypothetical protein
MCRSRVFRAFLHYFFDCLSTGLEVAIDANISTINGFHLLSSGGRLYSIGLPPGIKFYAE